MQQGLVVRDQSGFFWVEAEDGRVIVCRLRGRLMEAAQSSDIAAVGDRVEFNEIETEGGVRGVIEAVLPRKSVISRAVRTEGVRGAGAPEREQVIIANPDQILIVFAAAQPDPNPRQIDRFLVVAEKAQLDRILLIVNKNDLRDLDETKARFGLYERLGYTVIYTCAIDGTGIEALRDALTDKISAFTGPSGVGKTSLLNQLQPGLARVVKQVSGYHEEGVHTTRDSQLVRLDFGGYLADTPGLRNLALWDIEPDELDAYFREIAPLVPRCRFGDCTHHREPGCAVRAAVEAGTISKSRYRSFLAIREELAQAFAAQY